MKNLASAFALGISLSAVSCSSSPSAGDASALGIKAIPLLASPTYEAKWGKPKVRVSSAGTYELNYANPAQPFDRLAIFGAPKPFPVLLAAPDFSKEELVNDELTGVNYPQSFRAVTVNGAPVRWFKESGSGGADGAYYATTGFSVTDSSGKTGHYRLVVEGGDDMEAEVARRFSSVVLAP